MIQETSKVKFKKYVFILSRFVISFFFLHSENHVNCQKQSLTVLLKKATLSPEWNKRKKTIIVLEALKTFKIITFLYEGVDSKLREARCSRKTMLTLPLSKQLMMVSQSVSLSCRWVWEPWDSNWGLHISSNHCNGDRMEDTEAKSQIQFLIAENRGRNLELDQLHHDDETRQEKNLKVRVSLL